MTENYNNNGKVNEKSIDAEKCKENSDNATCGYCKIEFKVPKYKIKNLKCGKVKNLFCKKQCLQNWQKINFTKDLIKKTCPHCKESYKVKNKGIEQIYCSNKCLGESRKVVVDLECDYCNKEFFKKPSMVKDKNFCTKKCSEDYSSKIHKESRIKKTCEICNKEFSVKPSQNRLNCCSKECSNRWKSEVYPKTENGEIHLRACGLKSTLNSKSKDTKPERLVREFLIHKNIKFIGQYQMYNKFIVDYYLPDTNTIIEVLGDYWHGNPLKYGDDKNLKPLTDKQLRQKSKDKSRYAYLTTCGHPVLMVWECDIYNDVEASLMELFK